jgi:serine/threonine protein phosphatase 1
VGLSTFWKGLSQRLPWPAAAAAAASRPFHVPHDHRVYAIGDIHGEAGLLRRLLAKLQADSAARDDGQAETVIFLGDYIDRGPESRQVLDILTGDPFPGAQLRFVRGNHEQALLDFLVSPLETQSWLNFGGVETLASYGLRVPPGLSDPARLTGLAADLAARLPPRHLDFLRRTELMVIEGDYVFVHAGIRPGVPLPSQRPDDLLWIREGFIDRPLVADFAVVHGHTIVDVPLLEGSRIAIDTGAYATGRLTAVALSGSERRIIQVEGG